MLLLLFLYSFDFLDIPIGARYGALRSNLILENEPFALFFTPTGIITTKKTFATNYNNYLLDMQSSAFVGILPFKNGNIGIGLNYFNYGKFEEKNGKGEYISSFSPFSLVSVLGYAKKINKLLLGANFKFVCWRIGNYGITAIGSDLSLLYKDRNRIFGIGLQNFIMQINAFYKNKEKLPTIGKVGFGYYFSELSLNLSVEGIFPRNEFTIGLEWLLSPILTLRFGYYSYGKDLPKSETPIDILSKTSLGIGLKVKKILFNYSFTPMGALGVVNQISLIY